MRTEDILGIVDVIDNVGYYSLEMWGGATFDVCLRFLRENPWERLRLVKSKVRNTPLQMLLRGQNLVGYRNYADDVVDRFVALACENGIDIFRVFDALNDTRNLEAAIKSIKRHGGHAQGTLAYTISPVHTVEKFVAYAREQVAVGIDSLCIKDMAGILSPIAAEKLVKALIENVGIPIQLHCHATSGMGTATYVEGVRAGAGAIDCAVSTMSGFSSQPPVESLATIFLETNYSANIDMEALAKVASYFAALVPNRRLESAPEFSIDPNVLLHQIPGGMISNFRSQLQKQGALDKLPEVLKEVAEVRKDLGYPPLVTPTSQIVGTQAVMNIVAGERYKMVPNEVKEYVRGMYGRSPSPLDPKFIKKILGDEKPIKYRPADKLEPMLPRASDGVDAALIKKEEDIISYCILPEPALEYFKWRNLPPAERPEIPADQEAKKQAVQKETAKAPDKKESVGAKPALSQMMHPEDYKGFGQILREAAGLHVGEILIKKGDFNLVLRSGGSPDTGNFSVEKTGNLFAEAESKSAEPAAVTSAQQANRPEMPKSEEPQTAASEPARFKHTVKSPLVGTFYLSDVPGKPPIVNFGDKIKKGEKICMVEAMKLFNEIRAEEDCRILAFLAKDGQSVEADQALIAYEPVTAGS